MRKKFMRLKQTIFILMLYLSSGVLLQADESKVKIYGFFDMEVEVNNKDVSGKRWTFNQHHLNIITIYNIEKNYRLFTEVEYEHGPSHKKGEFYGKIYLGKAFFEYKMSDAFKIRAGKFLTPFGIYNERHDATPTFLSTKLPHSIYGLHHLAGDFNGRIFSKFSTGVQVVGSLYPKDWEVKYQIYVSNGRGDAPSEKDNNTNKGIGGRLIVSPPLEGLSVGSSYYTEKNGLDFDSRQKSLGFDIEFTHENLYFESESIIFQIERLDIFNIPTGVFRKGYGFYSTVAYSFREKITPFFRYEYEKHDIDSNDREHLLVFGLNYSINPRVYVKNELHLHHTFGSTEEKDEMFSASLAVAF